MTQKLYYQDSYISEFDATVLSCEALPDGRYVTALDRTAFFPEGGGQPGDTGVLGGIPVLDTHEKDGSVLHYTEKPLEIGRTVHGKLDFDRRFRLMQNHSGEHIVSGIVNRRFGYNNVGFHMGSEDITVDYDGTLDREQLLSVELEANRIVCRNLAIKAEIPSPEVLKTLHYRSKKALDGDVRIVTVENTDCCACCAPHLSCTGAVGIIKLLDAIKYKGGVRVHMQCGFDALDDYNRKYEAVKSIATALSAKQNEVYEAFLKHEAELDACRASASYYKSELLKATAAQVAPTEGNICLFAEDLTGDDLRKLAVTVAEKCGGVCAVFSGSDGAYSFVMVSRKYNLKALSKQINAVLDGKGGGSPEMIQGSAGCTRQTAEELLKENEIWQMQ